MVVAESDISSEECRAQAVAWFLSSEKTIAEIAGALNLSESVVREWVWNASPEDVSDKARPEAEAEAATRAEAEAAHAAAAANAAAVEAVLRAEILAADAVARAEAVAAEAKAAAADAHAQLEAVRAELEAARAEIAVRIAAEAAARDEIRAVYAEAIEAIIQAEAGAAASVQAHDVQSDVVEPSEEPPPTSAAPVEAAARVKPDQAEAEAEARVKIADLMARRAPVEMWVHATGRTLEAARAEALARLGVDESQAEIEVLASGSRWLPGGVQVRARKRDEKNSRS